MKSKKVILLYVEFNVLKKMNLFRHIWTHLEDSFNEVKNILHCH